MLKKKLIINDKEYMINFSESEYSKLETYYNEFGKINNSRIIKEKNIR